MPPDVWETWRLGMAKNLCKDKTVCKMREKAELGDGERQHVSRADYVHHLRVLLRGVVAAGVGIMAASGSG